MPSLVASYFTASPIGGDSSSLVTPMFTPSNGEVIVVKAATWDTNTASGTPSGGGLTYVRRATGAPGGFNGYTTIFTTIVSGSPGSMTVTLSPPASNSHHSMVVERWGTAGLATIPATNGTITGVGTPSATITTTGTNSIVTWVNVDEQSNDPTGATYLSGATQDGLSDGHVGSDSVHYYAYQTATVAGAQTIGMSVPASQKWSMVGIEVMDATAPPPTSPPGAAFMTFFE